MLAELTPALKDAAGIEIQPGKRYLFFVDPMAINREDLMGLDIGTDAQGIFLSPPQGGTFLDAVAAFELPEVEHDAGGMSLEGEEE